MMVSGAIPMSSPKDWPPEKRAAQKLQTLAQIRALLDDGHSILLFPAGKVRRQPHEIVPAYLTGVHDILNAQPDTPLMLLRLGGLGKFQPAIYDLFYSFIGRTQGRRHVSLDLQPLQDLDPSLPIEDFNAKLETLLNS